MSSKTDQKSLELLYESIVENKDLLRTEEDFIDKAAKKLVDQLFEEIDYIVTGGSNPGEFFSTWPLADIITKENIFKGSKEEVEAFSSVFKNRIFKDVKKYVYSLTRYAINFKNPLELWPEFVEGPDNTIENFGVSKYGKERILKKFKDILKHLILYYYQICSGGAFPSKSFHIWYEWRKEKLKFEGLRKKLPELEGIFD